MEPLKTVCVDGLNEKWATYKPRWAYQSIIDDLHGVDDPTPLLVSVDLDQFKTDDGSIRDYYSYNYVANHREADAILVWLFHSELDYYCKRGVWDIVLPCDFKHDLSIIREELPVVTVQLYEIGKEEHGPLCTFSTRVLETETLGIDWVVRVPPGVVIKEPHRVLTVCVAVTDGQTDDFVYPPVVGQVDLFGVVNALSGRW